MADARMKTKINLGPAIGSYANIFKPRAVNEGDEPKYSISLLFPKKSADKMLAELRKVIEFVATEKFGVKYKTFPKFHIPIRDGDVEKPEHKEYAGMLFCNMSSTRAPGIINRHGQPIVSEDEAFSGCKFVTAVNVYAFEKKGNKGVALGLNNVCMFEKGERIDGRSEAAEDFKEFLGDGAGSSGASEPEEDPLS